MGLGKEKRKKLPEKFGSCALKFLPLHPLLKTKAARVDILFLETVHGSSSFFYFFLPPFRQERRRGKRKGKKKKLPEKFGSYALKFLPLHPLSERNSIAVKTAIFEQIYINNTSSTRARPLPGNGGWSWVKQKNRQYLSMTGIDKLLNSSVLNRAKTYSCPGLLSYSLWGLVLVSAS